MGGAEIDKRSVKDAAADSKSEVKVKAESLLLKRVALVKEAKVHLPIAEHIADGLILAKQEAVEEVRGELDEMKATVTGTQGLAEQIKTSAQTLQSEAAAAKGSASSAEREAAAAKSAAQTVNDKIAALEVGGEKGLAALAKAAELADGIPQKVKDEVKEEVTAVVTRESGITETLFGKKLMAYLVSTAENARRSAGKALKGGAKSVAALDDSFKETVVHVLATLGATVTKAGLEQADDDEVEAEKEGIKKALADAGAQESDDTFRETVVHILATIGATITKAGLEQADDSEVEAEKAGIKTALSNDDS